MAHITYITHIINIIARFRKNLYKFCIFTIHTICKKKIETDIIVQNRNYSSTTL